MMVHVMEIRNKNNWKQNEKVFQMGISDCKNNAIKKGFILFLIFFYQTGNNHSKYDAIKLIKIIYFLKSTDFCLQMGK